MLFEGFSWLKFSNSRQSIRMALTFYTSVAEVVTKSPKLLGLIPMVVDVTGEKLEGGFLTSDHLNRV